MNPSKPGTEPSDPLKVLVIDDERLSSHNLGIQLRFVGEAPVPCSSERWQEAAAALGEQRLLAVVVGAVRPEAVAPLLQGLQQQLPATPVLQISALPEAALAAAPPGLRARLQLLDETALNYESMAAALQRARQLRGAAPRRLESRVISSSGSALFRSLSGRSRSMQLVRQQVQLVARRDVTVLVLGESGTGKEVVARNLHYHSGRGDAPFTAVNCAAITPDRYGVELFGQAGGAAGLLERANGGTLYLDEIAELPLNIQTLLLRFLEEKTFHRSGGSELVSTDVRVVAGTALNLQSRIQQGLFRADLYYRLTLMPIELPPLRRRLEDIPELVQELLKHLGSRGYGPVSLNAAAIDALQHQRWPGNVRELANLIERLCIMHGEGVLGVNDLPLEYQHAGDTEALLQEIEALTSKVEARVGASARSARAAEPVAASASAAATQARSLTVTGVPAETEAGSAAVAAVAVRAAADGQDAQAAARAEAPSVLQPLNDALLQQYLQNFEKQLLLAALDDCASILGFAAERLAIDEAELKQKIHAHGLQGF